MGTIGAYLVASGAFKEVFGMEANTVDSNKLEHACKVIYAGFPSFFGLGLEDGHLPTFWILL